jgi:SIR2-like domain
MSWKVTWRDTADTYVIKKEEATTELKVLEVIEKRLKDKVRDISVTMQPPQLTPGGVPFPDIISAFREKKVVPFLGAGVPFSGRPEGADWRQGASFLPSGAELARHLAFLCNLPAWSIRDTDNLARVASYYTISNPNSDLTEELRTIFAGGSPTGVHQMLAELKLHPGMLIVTTNYDTLMEQALDAKGVPYYVVIHCTDIGHLGSVLVQKPKKQDGTSESEFIEPKDFFVDLKTTTVIHKMHGSISGNAKQGSKSFFGNFVITEEDYVAFLSRISSAPPVVPSLFRTHFGRCSFLFLGYSLEDWNVRVILDSLNDVINPNANRDSSAARQLTRTGDPPLPPTSPVAKELKLQTPTGQESRASRRHWAIQHQPSSYDIEVWRGRNVVIRNMDLNVFPRELRTRAPDLFP